MDETYGTYVDDECLDIHDYDDDTHHGTDDATDDDTDDDIDDDTDDGGRGNRRPLPDFVLEASKKDKARKFRAPFWKYSRHNCPFNP